MASIIEGVIMIFKAVHSDLFNSRSLRAKMFII